jgi:hypothetical protein
MCVERSLHPWDEANMVMLNDLSDMLLDLVCHYFIDDFCNLIEEIGL